MLAAAAILMSMSTVQPNQRIRAEEVAAFLKGLERVSALPEDEFCSICLEYYSKPKTVDIERPVKLPCGHIIGNGCIRRWLDGGHDTCPVCRHKLQIKKG